jgi:tetratricopeptide (TPR) repeat protein
VKLLRERARRQAEQGDATSAVFGLMALHADRIALESVFQNRALVAINRQLDEDLQEFGPYLGQPEVMYALNRIERASEGGSNLLADAIARCALAGSLVSDESHLHVGRACVERAWDAEARLELGALAGIEDSAPSPSRLANQAMAHVLLGRNAEMSEHHQSAADHFDRVLAMIKKYEREIDIAFALHIDPGELELQAISNHLQAARKAGKTPVAQQMLARFINQPAPDSDTAIAVVRDLRASGRKEDADAYFTKSYEIQNAKLSERGDAAKALNNLAWLCSQCGERATEALELSDRAVAMEPENYAYIDTAASAYFAAGNAAEAARLERRALIVRPNDSFMRRQLEKFEKGQR